MARSSTPRTASPWSPGSTSALDESIATEVVERLRAHRIFASVNRRVGVYNVGVRVVLTDGREAIWDNDATPGLEAMVLRDGVLVGFVPLIPDTEGLDADAITAIVAATDYDAPPAPLPVPARTWSCRLRHR